MTAQPIEVQEATPAQYAVIRTLSAKVFGLDWEWTIIDDFQAEEPLDTHRALQLAKALQKLTAVKGRTRGELREALDVLMAGDDLPFQIDAPPLPVKGTVPPPPPAQVSAPAQPPLVKEKPLPERKPISHGTHAGYVAHRSRGEDACPDCKEAARIYQRERGRIKRAANGSEKPEKTAATRPRARATSARAKTEKPAATPESTPEPRTTSARPYPVVRLLQSLDILGPPSDPQAPWPRPVRQLWLQMATIVADNWPDDEAQ